MKSRLMLAFSNMLFSEGIARLVEHDRSIDVVEMLPAEGELTNATLASLQIDIILTDLTTLFNVIPDIDVEKVRIILLDTHCGRDNIVSAVLKKRVNGVLLGNTTPALLIKAIKAVAKGDIWIDKGTIKNMLNGLNALGRENTSALSDREREVISLVSKGFRNKEIAQKLNIGEPTVKTHLHRIFQKLNIKTRTELITYSIKNHDIRALH